MKYYNTKEFKRLEREWATKLKQSGFEDAEEQAGNGERRLRQTSSGLTKWLHFKDEVQGEANRDYYSLMSEAIHLHWFESDIEEQLIRRVAEGEKLGAVAIELGIHRQTARYMVRRFEHRYLIRKWSLKEMNLANADSSYSIVRFVGADLPEQYYNMVLSQFLRSLRAGNEYFKLMDPQVYYDKYSEFVKLLLKRPDMIVSIAALTDEKDIVLAWSLSEGATLHYVYCKRDYRRHGIATSILPKNLEQFSHLTTPGAALWNTKFPNAKFNPWS